MRFLVKVYEDGGLFAVETTDDGSSIVRPLQGSREVAKRLSVFAEVLADDTPDGVARLEDALKFLQQAVTARRNQLLASGGN
jgi:hypothetical protein